MKITTLILCVVFVSGALLVGFLYQRYSNGETMLGRLRKAAKMLEKEYWEVKKDPNKVAILRQEWHAEAIRACTSLKENYELSKADQGERIREAIDDTLEALRSGEIEDGIPRVVFATWSPDPCNKCNYMMVCWVESDFDTESILVRDEARHITIEANIFENHNLEKECFFQYYRGSSVKMEPISELGVNPEEPMYVLLKYVGEGVPLIPSAWWGGLPPGAEIAMVYVPAGEFSVSVRDKAGNESNELPVVRMTDEILRVPSFEESVNALMPGLFDPCEMDSTSTKSP